ncbi:MAG: Gfo/Idh/MocA family oxidoreductase [Synergistaceae bacterium]|nr:Gfo/Idh/MocA family oxidoreductase [Synergistaceae bacterium]
MEKIKIGVISPSEIAFRRFLPALKLIDDAEYVGLALNSLSERYGENMPEKSVQDEMLRRENLKAENFVENFGGKVFHSYEELICSNEVDALYIPLPPALHYKFARNALIHNKHVLIEKPAVLSLENAHELSELAGEKKLALHENYMFVYHAQVQAVNEIIASGEIGEVRLIRIRFGFPMRAANDFRYVKSLGGGALNDAGGYTIKYASFMLGESAKILYAKLNYISGFEVDMFGSGALCNDEGLTAQISFGMDNDYKCELEIWGSKGTLSTGRILTAPAGFVPEVIINGETRKLPADDAFKKSIEQFILCINDENARRKNYSDIIQQAELVEKFRKKAEDE